VPVLIIPISANYDDNIVQKWHCKYNPGYYYDVKAEQNQILVSDIDIFFELF
jgi:hypothetical protein